MKIFFTAALAVACMLLAVSLVLYFDLSEENRTQAVKLIKAETSLTLTEMELSNTESDLEAVKGSLSSLQEELAEIESILSVTRNELAAAAENYHDVSSSLAASENNAASLQESLSATNARLELTERTLYGLGITVSSSSQNWDAVLVDNPEAYDPTLAELKAFLEEDRTEHHWYERDVYDCSEFSRDLHNRAEAAGIAAGVVHIWWNEPTGHALNVFLTTDYGLVYVDSTEAPDCAARVVRGKIYRVLDIDTVPPQYLRNDVYWDNLTWGGYILTDAGRMAAPDGIDIYW